MIITSIEGGWPEEVSWELLTADGEVILEGGASYTNIVGECGDIIEGCMDQEAINFNPDANFPVDEMCDYAVLGCTDEDALNFNPDATHDDESCEYPIDCEELTLVSVDGGDWQSEVSWSIVDCNNNELISGGAPFNECMELPADASINMSDSYGDGWNGNILTIGDATFTLESGAEGSGVLGNGCADIIEGCTDEDALNFNPEATEDDGACEYSIDCENGILNMNDSYGDGWNGNTLIINNVEYTLTEGSAGSE